MKNTVSPEISVSLPFLVAARNDPKVLNQTSAWLTHIRPVLALAKPKELSTSALLELLKIDQELGIVHKVVITNKHLQYIYAILALHSRSEYITSSITTPEYSAAVPIALQAYKEHWGIKYSRWNLDNDYMNAAVLGKGLRDLLKVRDYLIDINSQFASPANDSEVGDSEYEDSLGISSKESYNPFDPKQQKLWRAQTTANGEIKSTMYSRLKRVFPAAHPLGSTNVPKIYWCMLTQTWIFDPRVRHPDMITDLLDFDNLVDPLEEFTGVEQESITNNLADVFGI